MLKIMKVWNNMICSREIQVIRYYKAQSSGVGE